jgi:hypothetical protein
MMARALTACVLLIIGLLLGLGVGWLRLSEPQPGNPAANVGQKTPRIANPNSVSVDLSGLPADQREVAESLDLWAAFVRGTDLQGLELFLGGVRPKKDRLERQVYLVACLRTRTNTGKRLLSVTLEMVRPERLAGRTVRLMGGLLDDDCVYHVQQVVDTDTSLPGDPTFRSFDGAYVYTGDEGPSLREEILRSRPEFRIVEMHIH